MCVRVQNDNGGTDSSGPSGMERRKICSVSFTLFMRPPAIEPLRSTTNICVAVKKKKKHTKLINTTTPTATNNKVQYHFREDVALLVHLRVHGDHRGLLPLRIRLHAAHRLVRLRQSAQNLPTSEGNRHRHNCSLITAHTTPDSWL